MEKGFSYMVREGKRKRKEKKITAVRDVPLHKSVGAGGGKKKEQNH